MLFIAKTLSFVLFIVLCTIVFFSGSYYQKATDATDQARQDKAKKSYMQLVIAGVIVAILFGLSNAWECILATKKQ